MSEIGLPGVNSTLRAGPIEKAFLEAYVIKEKMRGPTNELLQLVNPALYWRNAEDEGNRPLGQIRQTMGMRGMAAIRGTLLDTTWPRENPIRFDCCAPADVEKRYSPDERQQAKAFLDKQAHTLWDSMNSARVSQRAFASGRGFRSSMSVAIDFALGHGDVCLWGQKDFLFEVMRPEQWVVVRDGQGNELRLILRRKIDPLTFSGEEQIRAMLPVGWMQRPLLQRLVWVYTNYQWDPKGRNGEGEWVQTDETNGQDIFKDSHDEARIFSVPWYLIPGDQYGRSFFEIVFAMLSEVDHLSGAAMDLVNICADVKLVLDQNSTIRPSKLIAPSGAIITGGRVVNGIAQDLGAISVNKHQDLREVREEKRLRESELATVLAMDIDQLPASKDRTPRVLVEEVARRLNATTGGQTESFVETMSTKVQRCCVSIAQENNTFDRVPENIKGLIDDWWQVRMTSGVAGIARSNRVNKLLAWTQVAQQIGTAQLPEDMKKTDLIMNAAVDMGLDLGDVRMTPAELEQAQRIQINRQLQAQAALETIKATAPRVAESALAQ